ncbi:hypothetical protein GCM10019016_126680 [Streptomyces prasinosporus]|uniref:Uncharacterized protein n=1 Tax=Streptomyces prasinosporus TaxID=68256 RepID=A0ABP6UCX8_9ACTN
MLGLVTVTFLAAGGTQMMFLRLRTMPKPATPAPDDPGLSRTRGSVGRRVASTPHRRVRRGRPTRTDRAGRRQRLPDVETVDVVGVGASEGS